MKKSILIIIASSLFASSAEYLSLKSAEEYVFTNVAKTNLIHGVGIGTKPNHPTPVRLEDMAFCFEAAQERMKTAYANLTEDGILETNKVERKMSIVPNVSDYMQIYQSIYIPLSVTNRPYLLSTGLVSLAICKLSYITNGSDATQYTIPIATNDSWIGFNKFYEYPTYLTNSNGFRKVLSQKNISKYLYGNIDAATHMQYVRKGYASTNIITHVSETLYDMDWRWSEYDGWKDIGKYPYTNEFIYVKSYDIKDRFYHPRRTIRKTTIEAWSPGLYASHAYEGYQKNYYENLEKNIDHKVSVTNYLALADGQEIVDVEKAGMYVHFSHTRNIAKKNRLFVHDCGYSFAA